MEPEEASNFVADASRPSGSRADTGEAKVQTPTYRDNQKTPRTQAVEHSTTAGEGAPAIRSNSTPSIFENGPSGTPGSDAAPPMDPSGGRHPTGVHPWSSGGAGASSGGAAANPPPGWGNGNAHSEFEDGWDGGQYYGDGWDRYDGGPFAEHGNEHLSNSSWQEQRIADVVVDGFFRIKKSIYDDVDDTLFGTTEFKTRFGLTEMRARITEIGAPTRARRAGSGTNHERGHVDFPDQESIASTSTPRRITVELASQPEMVKQVGLNPAWGWT